MRFSTELLNHLQWLFSTKELYEEQKLEAKGSSQIPVIPDVK